MQLLAKIEHRIALLERVIGIGPVGDQSEVEIGIAVGQEADLQIQRQVADLSFVQKQRGNCHQGQTIVGYAGRQVELGKTREVEPRRR